MDPEKAQPAAEELTSAHFGGEQERLLVEAALTALLPDSDVPWTVTRLRDFDGAEGEPVLLRLVDGDLYIGTISELAAVRRPTSIDVIRHRRGVWSLIGVDEQHDGRNWRRTFWISVQRGKSFCVDLGVLDSEGDLGRAIARADGWEIDDRDRSPV